MIGAKVNCANYVATGCEGEVDELGDLCDSCRRAVVHIQCRNCRAYRSIVPILKRGGEDDRGQCRRHSPTVLGPSVSRPADTGLWPIVTPHDWCLDVVPIQQEARLPGIR